MVMGLTAVSEDKMPFAECLWYSNTACSSYERLIEECCLELDIPFLATFQEMRSKPSYESLIMPDGIHLNSEGHKWLFEKISNWPSLQKWAQS